MLPKNLIRKNILDISIEPPAQPDEPVFELDQLTIIWTELERKAGPFGINQANNLLETKQNRNRKK